MSRRAPGAHRPGAMLMAALCGLAGLRVAAGAMIYPPFNHLDEIFHFDRVQSAMAGRMPRGLEKVGPATARVAARYGSWEYLTDPGVATRAGEEAGPGRILATPHGRAIVARREAAWAGTDNRESFEPPLYYLLAGGWARVGAALGIGEAGLIFWIRLLNVPVFLAIMLAGWCAARSLRPDCPEIAVGTVLLLAPFGHEVFYGINTDIPVAALVGWGWWALWCGSGPRPHSVPRMAAGGLLLGLAVLTKAVAIPAAAVLLMGLLLEHPGPRRGRRSGWSALAAAAIPVVVWSVRDRLVLGDWFASDAKAAWTGWTLRPAAHWLDHPLLTLHGAGTFMTDAISSFWFGPLAWHGVIQRFAWLDALALMTTAAGLAGAVLLAVAPAGRGRAGLAAGLVATGAGVAAMAWISIRYDLGMGRDAGFVMLSAGRYQLAALVPVAVGCATGLDAFGRRCGAPRLGLAWCAGFGLLMLAHEAAMIARAVGSGFNGFHLP